MDYLTGNLILISFSLCVWQRLSWNFFCLNLWGSRQDELSNKWLDWNKNISFNISPVSGAAGHYRPEYIWGMLGRLWRLQWCAQTQIMSILICLNIVIGGMYDSCNIFCCTSFCFESLITFYSQCLICICTFKER